MFRYGFELECFWRINDLITFPPTDFPTDGFPGLVKIRTYGHHSLSGAFAALYEEELKLKIENKVGKLTFFHEHKFTPNELRQLRKRPWNKNIVDIQNIYDRKPRDLKGKTIASFQVSISNLVRSSYKDDKGIFHSDVFGLLDVPKIVKALDKEFSKEIKSANRQPGEYCIKGDRLEYRSLPNTIHGFATGYHDSVLMNRIKAAVED